MYRKPRLPNWESEALLEQRDELRIQISVLTDAQRLEPAELTTMLDQLADLERRISRHRRIL